MEDEPREVSQAVVRDMFVQLMHRLRIHRSLKPEALALERAMKAAVSVQSRHRERVKATYRQKRKRPGVSGYSRSFALALRHWRDVYVCANCNTCVSSPLGELPEDELAVVVELEDSKDRGNNISFHGGCNVKTSGDTLVVKSSDEQWLYQVKLVFCYGCDQALGVKVQSVAWRQDGNQVLRAIPHREGNSPIALSVDEKILFETLYQSWCNAKLENAVEVALDGDEDGAAMVREYLDNVGAAGAYVAGLRRSFCGTKSRISSPKPKFIKDNSTRISYLRLEEEESSNVCLGVLELGQTVICSRYLLLKRFQSLTQRCEPRSQLILCAHEKAGRECNNVLCESADLLSLRRNLCGRRGKFFISKTQ